MCLCPPDLITYYECLGTLCRRRRYQIFSKIVIQVGIVSQKEHEVICLAIVTPAIRFI